MKFAASLLTLVSLIAGASAHMALLYPTPRGGYGTKQYNGRVHTWIGHKDSKWNQRFPCGGYAPGPVTQMKAGQTINVRFLASTMSDKQIKTQPNPTSSGKQFSQARHGGGTCEFSLSYDGGKSFRRIGRYTKTCPDAYYVWPVKIPNNVTSCKKKNQCLFVWTWTANILPQYYQNCADIYLEGLDKGGVLPRNGIEIVDFKGYKTGVKGDGINHKSAGGPSKTEIKENKDGKYAKN
ncbi:hypothetical protein BGZ65_012154 [Modicella reniformis]|uniref:Chitin-binding type-4 domain-containing protein n=1 Tax=Modicella reniformis TaxID=1440133 RepID=A0A9P6IMI8_9FUNG|nr:hypothetical protein BGZ65_012154 [Modicella reniformis]